MYLKWNLLFIEIFQNYSLKSLFRTLRPIYWPWCMRTKISDKPSYTVIVPIVKSRLKSKIWVLAVTKKLMINQDFKMAHVHN